MNANEANANECAALQQRVADLEEELQEANKKLQVLREENEKQQKKLKFLEAHIGRWKERIKKHMQNLMQKNDTDYLTQLKNKGFFEKELERECGHAERNGTDVALIIGDIDLFSEVNNTYGHPVGDRVLQRVAEEISKVAHRSVDTVARIGGEEFAILLSGTREAGARHIIQKVEERCDVSLKEEFAQEGIVFNGMSLGFSVCEKPKGKSGKRCSPQELYACADASQYEEKRKRKAQREGKAQQVA